MSHPSENTSPPSPSRSSIRTRGGSSITLGDKSAAIIVNDDGSIKIITTGDNPASVLAKSMEGLLREIEGL